MNTENSAAANLCPLCGENNSCGQLLVDVNNATTDKACWCMDSAIAFPASLLSKLPEADKQKACICKTCVLRYQMYSDDLVSNAAARDTKRHSNK
ncbi:MAG: cysteine-rich CWC family protein [Paraglaciecola sp.]|uniref:cysteine-rich CWC family protein n=1 Tax=Paraglaciecola sp. TaxID=1920173 RepID=UPI00329769DC